jgi:signal transduction histidine kinase/FixJ family two-component response regulator
VTLTAISPPVLVVDDDEAMRETVVDILASAGIEAAGVASAADAQARQERDHPSVVLVDQRLPDATGIELGTSLKQADDDLTVVLVTGYASLENAIAAVSEFDGFLTKPVPPPELLRVVTAGLERARLRRENRGLVSELASSVAERTAELSGLLQLTEALAETTALDDLAHACVRIALDVTHARAAGLYLDEDGQPAPRLCAQAGGIALPAVLDGGGEAVMLTAGGRRIGALVLDGPVNAQPMFLSTFAGVTAVAIQNAQRLSVEREAVERLSELSRMKSTLLATVSHELRTPLTTVVGFADLLGREFDRSSPEERREMLDLIIEQGSQLRVLIEDLVDASRVEFGTLRVRDEEVDLAAVVDRVARPLEGSPNPIVVRLPAELPPVRADESRVQQVVANLVGNAGKHSPEGTPVEIVVRPEEQRVAVAVVDRGNGIDPQFLPSIFEPFAQQERGGARGTGLGLGLYIVRGLVEAMGGTVEASSTLGEGSEFVVRLRRA